MLNVGRSEPKDIVFPDRDLATLPNWIKDSTTKGVIRKDTISRSLGGGTYRSWGVGGRPGDWSIHADSGVGAGGEDVNHTAELDQRFHHQEGDQERH